MPICLPLLISTTRRTCTSSTARSSSRSFSGVQGPDRHISPDSLPGRKFIRDKLWREFFSDPSHWWDRRAGKLNPKYPDFTHKKTQQSLWLADNLTPGWVECELAAMTPGLLQSHIFSWNVRLRRHVKAGNYKMALNLFKQMQHEGMILDKFTFVPLLNACSHLKSLEEGRRVHEQIMRTGYESDTYVANSLVDMYAKSGSIDNAWSVFSTMPERDVVSWNAMIMGYVKSGQGPKAMELLRKMQQEGVEPDAVTFVGTLNACASLGAIEEGRRVHGQIIRRGYESNVYVATCLVDMYIKVGTIEDAWSLFNKVRERNVVFWNAMIGGYLKSKQGLKALELFRKMQQECVEPNAVTFVGALNACANITSIEDGRSVHKQILQKGCDSVYVANCLVDMYAKCGSIEDAWNVFKEMRERDLVSWNTIIGGYVKSGRGLKAMELFGNMQQEGVEPDSVTFVGVLNACASVAALEEGRHVHEQIVQRGCDSDGYVANCLVDMYAKCGSIEDAWSLFNKMPDHDLVCWNAMIGGYVKSGQALKAMELFEKMQVEGVKPDTVTFIAVLNACASIAALDEGRRVNEQIIELHYESDIFVATCLVNMYAKCGSIEEALSMFNKMQEQTVVSWNAMIGGYAMHGHFEKALGLFKRMCKEGVELDEITFTCLLSACSHGGLVKEGLRYFYSMTSSHNVLPAMEHYVCMVDLLGRAGALEEAEKMTKNTPMEKSGSVWMSLLGACRIHGDIERAERAAKRCWELNPENASCHVLLSNIYAAVEVGEECSQLERKNGTKDQVSFQE